MNGACRKVEENLVGFMENEIPGNLRIEIDGHLKSCAECRFLVRRFSSVWKDFNSREESIPSDSLWTGIVSEIQGGGKQRFIGNRIWSGIKVSLRPAAAVLILLAGAFLGYHLGDIPEEPGVPVSLEDYIVEYFESFEDLPPGSAGDFYLAFPIREEKEGP